MVVHYKFVVNLGHLVDDEISLASDKISTKFVTQNILGGLDELLNVSSRLGEA